MQLYKGFKKIIPERIQYCIQKVCTNFFKYDVNKKNRILKIKKNHKAQNQGYF